MFQRFKNYFGIDQFIEGPAYVDPNVPEADRRIIRGLSRALLVIGGLELVGIAVLIGAVLPTP